MVFVMSFLAQVMVAIMGLEQQASNAAMNKIGKSAVWNTLTTVSNIDHYKLSTSKALLVGDNIGDSETN